MARRTGIGGRVYAWLRGLPPVRWLAARLSPGSRRAARRLVGRPSPSTVPSDRRPPTMEPRPAPIAPAVDLPPFVPDGSGSDPRMNVIGHFRGDFGMAEAARSLVTAAQAAGVRMALVSAHPNDARGTDLRLADAIGTETPYPINVLCVNANDTPQLVDQLGAEVIGAHYTVGFWFWELARLPAAWLGALDRVDEIWVASRFVAETMRAATSKPVRIVRLAVDATPTRPYQRSEFGLADDAYTFLFTFNFNSYVARKNPLGTIAAFRAAFPDVTRPVALVLKPTNADRTGERMREVQAAIGGDPRIQVIDRAMSRDEIFGLESVIDSYVSLHRSEGFGLGLAESMFLGKPVIGTAYSGNLEFMDGTNSLLLGYELTPVGHGEYPFPDGQVWAEPDAAHAVDHMRRLVDDRAFGRMIGAKARTDMQSRFSAEAVGAGIAARLREILDGDA